MSETRFISKVKLSNATIYSDRLFTRSDCGCIFELFRGNSPYQYPQYDNLPSDIFEVFETRPASISDGNNTARYYPGHGTVGSTKDLDEWRLIVGDDIFEIALFNFEIFLNPDSIIHECPND